MDPDEFQYFLKQSRPETFTTGDQSFFEAVSMEKVVFYDTLRHKLNIAQQVMNLFEFLLGRDQAFIVP
jgi:hypothetical protein